MGSRFGAEVVEWGSFSGGLWVIDVVLKGGMGVGWGWVVGEGIGVGGVGVGGA